MLPSSLKTVFSTLLLSGKVSGQFHALLEKLSFLQKCAWRAAKPYYVGVATIDRITLQNTDL